MHLWNQVTLSYLCCFPLCPCCQHHSLRICNNSVLTDCRDLACWKERLGWTGLSELGLECERDQPCKFLQTGMTVCPSTRGDTEAGKHTGHRHLGVTQCKEHVKCIWQRSKNKRLDHSYILFLTMLSIHFINILLNTNQTRHMGSQAIDKNNCFARRVFKKQSFI